MVKEAKGKTNDSFGSQLARNFFAVSCVSVKDSRSPVKCWKGEFKWIPLNMKQAKTIM